MVAWRIDWPGLLAGCLCALFAASAAAQWRQNGEVVPDELWRRSDGEFGAMLMLTDRADDFREQWARPPSPDYKPKIHQVSEAMRGDTVAAMILFSRCAASALGECRSDVDFRVLRPDGSVYAAHREIPLWNTPPPPETSLQLGVSDLLFQIEPTDPLGRYEIHAEVHDRVARRKVALLQVLTVVEGTRAPAAPVAAKRSLHGGAVALSIPNAWSAQVDEARDGGHLLLYEVPFAATKRTPYIAQVIVRSSPKPRGVAVAELAQRALRADLERPGFLVLASSADAPSWLTLLSTGGDQGARYAIIDRFAASTDWFVQVRIAFPLLKDAPHAWYDDHVSQFDEVLASLALHDRRMRASKLRFHDGLLTLASVDPQARLVAVDHPGLGGRPDGEQGLVVYVDPPVSPVPARAR